MIYLGRYIWTTDDLGPHWAAPAGSVAAIDLRPVSSCAKAGIVEGWGLFDIPSNPPATANLIPLAASMDTVPTNQIRNKIASTLNITVGSTETLGDILWRILTVDRDLIGANMCPGVLPDKGPLRISLGQFKREKPFAVGQGAEWPGVQADLQRQYRQLYNDAQAGLIPPKHYLKVLDFWCEDYKTADWSLFVPADLPQEAPIPHSTTLNESFNKANGALGPDLTWTVTAGGVGVVSNQAIPQNASVFNSARAESDLSSSNHYAQVTLTELGNGITHFGPAARYSSSAVTCYRAIEYGADNNMYLSKIVAGTETHLGNVAITPSIPEPIKIECNGSTITAYQNGVSRVSLTDTSITTGIRTGLHGYGIGVTAPTVDSFVAADLAAGGTDNLLANDVITGSPTASAGTIGQTHALSATGVSTGTPAAGAPALGQTHTLLAENVAAGSPTASSGVLGQVQALSANGLSTGAPLLGAPTVGNNDGVIDLLANDVLLGYPLVFGDTNLRIVPEQIIKTSYPAPLYIRGQKHGPLTIGKQFRSRSVY